MDAFYDLFLFFPTKNPLLFWRQVCLLPCALLFHFVELV